MSEPIPSSIAASTVRRSARVPSRWPSATGRPRDIAQRPLPSRMIATQPTGSGISAVRSCLLRRMREKSFIWCRERRETRSKPRGKCAAFFLGLDLVDLLFCVLQEALDLVRMVVVQLLDPLFGMVFLVAADFAL